MKPEVIFQCPKCGHEQMRNVHPDTKVPQYCPKHIAKDPLEFVPMKVKPPK